MANEFTDTNFTGDVDITGATTFGGGYGSTGATISSAGAISMDGLLTFGSSYTGTTTPTGVADTNIDSVTSVTLHWTRIGNKVFGGLRITADPTSAGTVARVGVPLPVASNFTAADDATGGGALLNLDDAVHITADTTNDRLLVGWVPSLSTGQTVYATFMYIVK